MERDEERFSLGMRIVIKRVERRRFRAAARLNALLPRFFLASLIIIAAFVESDGITTRDVPWRIIASFRISSSFVT